MLQHTPSTEDLIHVIGFSRVRSHSTCLGPFEKVLHVPVVLRQCMTNALVWKNCPIIWSKVQAHECDTAGHLANRYPESSKFLKQSRTQEQKRNVWAAEPLIAYLSPLLWNVSLKTYLSDAKHSNVEYPQLARDSNNLDYYPLDPWFILWITHTFQEGSKPPWGGCKASSWVQGTLPLLSYGSQWDPTCTGKCVQSL